jgi:hypothetical protein
VPNVDSVLLFVLPQAPLLSCLCTKRMRYTTFWIAFFCIETICISVRFALKIIVTWCSVRPMPSRGALLRHRSTFTLPPLPPSNSSDDDVPDSFAPDSFSQEENLFVPRAFAPSSELEAIKSGIRQLGLDSNTQSTLCHLFRFSLLSHCIALSSLF